MYLLPTTRNHGAVEPIVEPSRSWSRHDRGATEVRGATTIVSIVPIGGAYRVDSTIVEQQRCVPCRFHDRGATEVRTVEQQRCAAMT